MRTVVRCPSLSRGAEGPGEGTVPRHGAAPRAPTSPSAGEGAPASSRQRARTHPDQRRAGHPAAPRLALEERGGPNLHVPGVQGGVPGGSSSSGLCRRGRRLIHLAGGGAWMLAGSRCCWGPASFAPHPHAGVAPGTNPTWSMPP